jgi:hypothetical protein
MLVCVFGVAGAGSRFMVGGGGRCCKTRPSKDMVCSNQEFLNGLILRGSQMSLNGLILRGSQMRHLTSYQV